MAGEVAHWCRANTYTNRDTHWHSGDCYAKWTSSSHRDATPTGASYGRTDTSRLIPRFKRRRALTCCRKVQIQSVLARKIVAPLTIGLTSWTHSCSDFSLCWRYSLLGS